MSQQEAAASVAGAVIGGDVPTTSTALAEVPVGQVAPAEILSDDEIRRLYRVAEAFAVGGAYKDIKNAEVAFTKMLVGRTLGLDAATSMQGIHLVEGGIQLHYSTLATFIRVRPGYDYQAFWIKRRRPVVIPVENGERRGEIVGDYLPGYTGKWNVDLDDGRRVTLTEAQFKREPVELELVAFRDEDPLDLREVYGAVVKTIVGGEVRGVSRFTTDDAFQAQLIKVEKDRAAWNTSRRNMLLARAMSNAAKWDVPEVLGGMPTYAPGELEAAREQKSLTAPVGDGDDEGSGIDLGPRVEAIIARATEVGHRGLSNRAAVEMAVGRRSPGVVKDWERRANEALDKFIAEKAEAAKADETNIAAGDPEDEPVLAAEEVVNGEVVDEPTGESVPDLAAQLQESLDVVKAARESETAEPPAEQGEDDPEARLRAHLEAEEENK
jgi:hypothetical protein